MAKNLRAIRKRIASIKSTQQITKAMKMVAAAKLKRAQDRAVASRPYLAKILELISSVAGYVQEGSFPLLEKRNEEKKVAILVYTSNRGLCGAYNSNLIRHAESIAKGLKNEGKEALFFNIGKKGYDYFRKRSYNITKFYSEIRDNITKDQIAMVSRDLVNGFLNNDFDRVIVIYSKFHSAASNKPYSFDLLPVEVEKKPGAESGKMIIFEKDAMSIIEGLLPESILSRIFNAVLESVASEQGARMTAMEAATTNAGEILGMITLDYNKARQAIITQELVEITGSAEAQMK
jgi:F-type H+-transporting ATPase subunit gamma